jgi:nucleoporin NUP2
LSFLKKAKAKQSTNTPAAFSFGTPASAPALAVSKESSVEASTSEAESETRASEGSVSALLSGKGEGEENEDCLHEVRSKVWTLKEGKWADLGIGLFKIKKNTSDGKKRVLVRNEGNGKVMVNFRLVESFKPIKDKNVVSFLGFDGEGKPANYRCKVKTDDSANELAGALQREAVS